MLSAYVCRQCRIRLSRRIGVVPRPQWQSRAIVSLKTPTQQGGVEHAQEEAQTQVRDQEEGAMPNLRTHGLVRGSRYSGMLQDTNITPAYTGEEGQAADQEGAKPRSLRRILGYAERINVSLFNNVDVAWKMFNETYTARDCKALTDPPQGDVYLLEHGRVFQHVLRAVTKNFAAGKTITVTPTAVLFRYAQLGLLRPEYWTEPTVEYLTYEVIRAMYPNPPTPQRDLPSLLNELLSVWKLFFQCNGPKEDPLNSIASDWQLTPIETLPARFDTPLFGGRLQTCAPKYAIGARLAFCAAYLYDVAEGVDEKTRQQALPFLRLLERLLAGSRLDGNFVRSARFEEMPEDIQTQIKQAVFTVPRKAMIAIGKSGEAIGPQATDDKNANLIDFYLRRIARAVETKSSPVLLDGLWKQVEEAYTKDGKTAIDPLIYNSFLSGYLVLFNPHRSIEVWNHMVANGAGPDIRSWVALLEGCAQARDLEGLNATWTRMLNKGFEPDNYAWTTRINGLVRNRQVSQALATLDEMGRRWLAAENLANPSKTKKDTMKPSKAVNTCTKPSVEVVNGAISALVQLPARAMTYQKRLEFVQKILSWSTNFQIVPDAITYNSLIQLYLGVGDKRTAFMLIAQMEKQGLQGDAATHNMLITAAFDSNVFDGLSEQEQTSKILKIFDNLEESRGVRAIIEHMTARSFTPSAHAYTSIITYYFTSKPAKLAEVDALVHHLFTDPYAAKDRVLFDRLIEGYAAFNEVGKMMSVLARMSKDGRLPGWEALTAVVRALMQDGDHERAQAIVRDVERGEGVAKGGILGDERGRRGFMAMVREYGLGDEDQRMGEFMKSPGHEQGIGYEQGGNMNEQQPPVADTTTTEWRGDAGTPDQQEGLGERSGDARPY
ncbi:predicted protein [Pyrenophora tritici-repentis Pt-1C-BFP]|uniref:PPR-2 domain containing protein n=1 Tax=Pyrenophora tritici-repentis (strain Pt-1C-BFP) TaxID=426418 RepID=B2WK37_PYRTR|nr:uncharacterized protein PTRG_10226 [Pyrenophora tritici-repentis Pt-1C-BFP]EDU43277.1 predicted protein [Pyrenophora tritici-repentis Pt-1C-BFP]